MMHWWYGSGWGYLAMGVSMAAFWGLLIAAIVLIVRGVGRPTPASPVNPRDVLALRLAQGEIDETEYCDRLALLPGTSASPR